MADVIPVLLYHSVPGAEEAAIDRWAVSEALFARHLDVILKSGRVALSVGEIAAGLRKERSLPKRAVAITFDDGYQDTAAAIELLCQRSLRATVYLTTGEIGRRPMIDPAQVRLLAAQPETVELGAHSVTHPRLDELRAEEIEQEVCQSKDELQLLLGREVETFAYPHGAYDRRVREAVISAGFTSAAAVKNAVSHSEDDPWAIARWSVCRSTSAAQIARVLEGEGVPCAWSHERFRTRGYRTARRLRRRLSLRLGP